MGSYEAVFTSICIHTSLGASVWRLIMAADSVPECFKTRTNHLQNRAVQQITFGENLGRGFIPAAILPPSAIVSGLLQ
jgi:hypothetical protein